MHGRPESGVLLGRRHRGPQRRVLLWGDGGAQLGVLLGDDGGRAQRRVLLGDGAGGPQVQALGPADRRLAVDGGGGGRGLRPGLGHTAGHGGDGAELHQLPTALLNVHGQLGHLGSQVRLVLHGASGRGGGGGGGELRGEGEGGGGSRVVVVVVVVGVLREGEGGGGQVRVGHVRRVGGGWRVGWGGARRGPRRARGARLGGGGGSGHPILEEVLAPLDLLPEGGRRRAVNLQLATRLGLTAAAPALPRVVMVVVVVVLVMMVMRSRGMSGGGGGGGPWTVLREGGGRRVPPEGGHDVREGRGGWGCHVRILFQHERHVRGRRPGRGRGLAGGGEGGGVRGGWGPRQSPVQQQRQAAGQRQQLGRAAHGPRVVAAGQVALQGSNQPVPLLHQRAQGSLQGSVVVLQALDLLKP